VCVYIIKLVGSARRSSFIFNPTGAMVAVGDCWLLAPKSQLPSLGSWRCQLWKFCCLRLFNLEKTEPILCFERNGH